MKAKLLTGINSLIVLLLGFLGFSACEPKQKYGIPVPEDDENVRCMYGCPYVTLEVSGTVTDEEHQPLQDMQVNLSVAGYRYQSMYSDSLGRYEWRSIDGGMDSVDLIVCDPQGVYEGDSVRVATDTQMFDEWRDWQVGESTVHHDFQLKKK